MIPVWDKSWRHPGERDWQTYRGELWLTGHNRRTSGSWYLVQQNLIVNFVFPVNMVLLDGGFRSYRLIGSIIIIIIKKKKKRFGLWFQNWRQPTDNPTRVVVSCASASPSGVAALPAGVRRPVRRVAAVVAGEQPQSFSLPLLSKSSFCNRSSFWRMKNKVKTVNSTNICVSVGRLLLFSFRHTSAFGFSCVTRMLCSVVGERAHLMCTCGLITEMLLSPSFSFISTWMSLTGGHTLIHQWIGFGFCFFH